MFEVDIGTVAVPAKNWYDFMGAENGESRTNYLTLAVQAYFSEEYLQILLIILPYTLIRTGFFKKKMRLADIQSFLSSLAIARLSWEAPLAQLVQSLGLDYATKKVEKATFGDIAMSGKNQSTAVDVLAGSAIFGLMRYFSLLN